MATFTTTQFNAAIDNMGQFMVDAAATLPTTSGINTASGDLTTEITRIQALTDNLVQPALLEAWTIEQRTIAASTGGTFAPTGRTLAYLNGVLYAALLANGPYNMCDALEFVCNNTGTNTGVIAFMTANSLTCDVYSADVFNSFVNAVSAGAYQRKFGTGTPAKIASTQIFPHTNVDYINQWVSSGTTLGSLNAGTASLAALAGGVAIPGGGTLEAYAGALIGASSYTITATYTNIAGATGQTVTFTIPSASATNTVFVPGATVQAASIQSIAVTTGTGTSGDKINFRLKPIRTITA